MILVTGGAGFIGSNLVRALNRRGEGDVVVVDDLRDGRKFANLAGCRITDYLDKDDFLASLARGGPSPAPRAILHQGACSDTTEWDGRYLLGTNYEYSKALLDWALQRRIPFLYASSAAIYGAGRVFHEEPACEGALNLYGWSKQLFDDWVRRRLPSAGSQVAGLRYFNVYGPGEAHKGPMASVVWHFHRQLVETGRVRLFEGSHGYAAGEQRRDFVHVDDVVAVNLWLLEHPGVSGVFNVGTGRSRTFNDVARAVIDWHGRGEIEYIGFPPALAGCYQSFTEADPARLRAAGYDALFVDVEAGVRRYLDGLRDTPARALSPAT